MTGRGRIRTLKLRCIAWLGFQALVVRSVQRLLIPGTAFVLVLTAVACVYADQDSENLALANVPEFSPSERCPTPNADACASYRMDAHPLTAAPGARVYREIWRGPFVGPMGHGSIVLTVHQDGTRTLRTPWRRGEYRLRPSDLPDFEATLARSDFATLPVYNQSEEICVDGVATTLEAIVDNNYRIAYFDFCGGVSSESVATALDQLFVFSAHLSGLRYPVNPDRPTFRG